MQNTNLLRALVANLEAAHRIANELVEAAEAVNRKEQLDVVKAFFEDVVKKANDTQTEAEVPAEVPAEAETQAEVPAAAPATVTALGIVEEMLRDPGYTLRSVESIMDKLVEAGFDEYEGDESAVLDFINDNFNVVNRRRRSDRALLVGLRSRN